MGAAPKQYDISDTELDEILASVERSLSATQLAKSASMPSNPNGGPMKKDDTTGEPEKKPTDGMPPEAGGEPPAGPEAGGSPAPEAGGEPPAGPEAGEGQPPQPGEQALEGEGSGEQPLSDEELDQIYGSMQPEELERHYMAIRHYLEQHMGGEPSSPEGAPAPGPSAPPEQAMKSEDARPAQVAKAQPAAPAAETDEVKNLKAKVDELQKGLAMAVKAVETVLVPSRKSAAGIEFVKKNEELEGSPREDLGKLNRADIDARIKQIGPAALSKSEREAVNGFLLDGAGKEKVLDIIKSKGGK